jgi:F-type H+-transporting ATPase subunit gamma
MASLREIRSKIKSVKSTQQITKAMKMVAAARMRKAQIAILSSRPFAVKLEATVRQLALLEIQADEMAGREVQIHPFFDPPKTQDSLALLLVTGDKGLCGAFNTNIIRAGLSFIKENADKKIFVTAVGRKGRDVVRRLNSENVVLENEVTNIFPKVNFAHAELVGKPLLEGFLGGRFGATTVIYNEFKSAVSQRVISTQLMPIAVPEGKTEGQELNPFGYHFEPERQQLLEELLPRYLKAQLYRILLESQAAELAARMNAMEAATKNAGDLLDSLTLVMNRTRQTIITNEIAELVGGAEALAN